MLKYEQHEWKFSQACIFLTALFALIDATSMPSRTIFSFYLLPTSLGLRSSLRNRPSNTLRTRCVKECVGRGRFLLACLYLMKCCRVIWVPFLITGELLRSFSCEVSGSISFIAYLLLLSSLKRKYFVLGDKSDNGKSQKRTVPFPRSSFLPVPSHGFISELISATFLTGSTNNIMPTALRHDLPAAS